MTPKARGLPLQRVAKPEAQRYETADKAEPASTGPDPDEHDREDLICRIRHMFGDGEERKRVAAIDPLAREVLGRSKPARSKLKTSYLKNRAALTSLPQIRPVSASRFRPGQRSIGKVAEGVAIGAARICRRLDHLDRD